MDNNKNSFTRFTSKTALDVAKYRRISECCKHPSGAHQHASRGATLFTFFTSAVVL